MFATPLEALMRDDRTMRAVFGIGADKFRELGTQMDKFWRKRLERRPNRQRAPGAGIKGKLFSGASKVAFILFYMKVYPTFDVLSAIAGINRGECCRWVHKLLPIMEEILKRKHVLPKRRINSLEEFAAAFPGVREIIIDGMERPIRRPKFIGNIMDTHPNLKVLEDAIIEELTELRQGGERVANKIHGWMPLQADDSDNFSKMSF